MAVLSAPTNTPTLDGAVIGCTTDDTSGTAYAMVRTDRQWHSVANGDSQALADADKATIIAQDITASELVWAGTDADLATIQVTIDGLAARLDPANPYYVGWVQEEAAAGYGDAMALEYVIAPGNLNLVIPTRNFDAAGYIGNIDWGDGQNDDFTSFDDPPFVAGHTYGTPNTYIVTITGEFSRLYHFDNATTAERLGRVLNIGATGLVDGLRMFYGCTALTDILAEGNTDLTSAASLRQACTNCTSLTTVAPAAMSAHAGMSDFVSVFESCSSLVTIDLSQWVMTGAVDLNSFFQFCDALENATTTGWTTPSLIQAKRFLWNFGSGAVTGLNLPEWDVSEIIDLTQFITNKSIATAEYSDTLIAWEEQPRQTATALTADFGLSTYNAGAASAHASLAAGPPVWTINDGGPE